MQSSDDILICNAGSSSLKLARWNTHNDSFDPVNYEGSFEDLEKALQRYLQENLPCSAALHRIVHGGDSDERPHKITKDVRERIEHWQVVAPQHNAIALSLIALVQSEWCNAENFALFDSALYAHLPEVSRGYALPENLSSKWPIRRYGFHGLAHRAQWALLTQNKVYEKVITLQLGSGCSASAWLNGEVVDTTMGFSPLEGLPMATRCGNIDASVVLHLLQYEDGHTTSSLRRLLSEHSGLKGLSGISGDIRKLMDSDDESATRAINHFCYQIQKTIGSYIAVLGGVDAITFGGGIGENQDAIRHKILSPLKNLSIVLDEDKNSRPSGFTALHDSSSQTELWLTPVDEIRQMARQFNALAKGQEKI